MGSMKTKALRLRLPSPEEIMECIVATEDELKALRRLLRASRAMRKAEDARHRRKPLEGVVRQAVAFRA